jgi:hypothetical protein
MIRFPGKLFYDRRLFIAHAQGIDAAYDGQIAGDGEYSRGIIVRLIEKVVAGETGNYYGNKQEYRY